MRIISSFTDVYDLQHSMFDRSRQWVRKSEDYSLPYEDAKKSVFPFVHIRITNGSFIVTPMFIYGEVHWLYAISSWTLGDFRTFSKEKALNYLKEHNESIGFFAKDKLENLSISSEQLKRFVEYKEPIVLVNKTNGWDNTITVTTNPRLIDLPWQEIDPNLYRLHQQLESYVFGVIGSPTPETVQVSEKDRLEARGFDTKKSFRNMK
ncbi:DNA polymerase III subunit epsilon [Pectobacterium phage DU_PP_V]|uniref:DNA polymerase III subunit epsilon n=1 Tax=Pectobacterium phage DU_PP_V TaxID=2041492 RepID=A0A2D2W6V0_9CAUD|nr:DNA polymerase III subunit epsilon [Pectobacterium phage DU_PP_V]ATS94018.1 DNA polymerase III subunit epsilon [Pectobacterium phage DU_PP_V]